MELGTIATALSLLVTILGYFGLSPKHPRVGRIWRSWSLPGWFLIVYPAFGEWFLRLFHQDFKVTATGSSFLIPMFNYLTTDSGHIAMVCTGTTWLVILVLPPQTKTRPVEIIEPGAVRAPRIGEPKPVLPMQNTMLVRRPRWKTVWIRNPQGAPWIADSPERNSAYGPPPAFVIAAVIPFSTSVYLGSVKARMTFADQDGKDFMLVPFGCWVGEQFYNDTTLRVSEIHELLVLMYVRDGKEGDYRTISDKRSRVTQTYDRLDIESCPVKADWKLTVEMFYEGKTGPVCVFDFFNDANGKLQLRNRETKEASE